MPRKNEVLKVGDKAPGFALRTSGGEEISLSDFKGKENVLLFFFRGTW